ncbi:MAG: tandem-95 repeat protein [Candidatus Dojkabacteria bacterium]|nr:MAG: tandem-95 repeat protein [Candidatus Dojkabacteria bacterium]
MNKDTDHQLKIVIIDDDFVVRQVLGLLLKHFAHRNVKIFTSDNGLEGLGYLMVVLPDIIILDTTLPKYSGTELAQFIVSNPRYHGQKLKVLLIEGKDQLSEGFLNLNKSDKDFIEKTLVGATGVNKENLSKTKIDRILLNAAHKTLSSTDKADQYIKKRDSSKNRFEKFGYAVAWLASQVQLSSWLLLINLFLGRWKDENEVQNREDLRKYRVRYYPTFATFFISAFFVLMQVLIYIAGGVTILNSRLDSVFADRERQIILTYNDASYSEQEVDVVEGKIYLSQNEQVAAAQDLMNSPYRGHMEYVLGASTDDSETAPEVDDESVETPIEDIAETGDVPVVDEGDAADDENVEVVVQEPADPAALYSDQPAEILFVTKVEYSELVSFYERSSHNNDATSTGDISQFDDARTWGVYYQLSPNGTDWYYHDGTEWVLTPAGFLTSNTVQEVNGSLAAFSESYDAVYVKAFMKSDGEKEIYFESLAINYEVGVITLGVEEEPIAEDPPVEQPMEVAELLENIEVRVMSAAWVGGNKVITGNVFLPEGISLTEQDVEDATVEINYTEDQDIKTPATNIGALIGQSPLVSYTNPETGESSYSFELVTPAEPGGYVTARLVINKPDEQKRYITNYSTPLENSTFTVDVSFEEDDFIPGDGFCDTHPNTHINDCTLRAAIQETNALAGSDNIHFTVLGVSPIVLTDDLPKITDSVVIDGTTVFEANCGDMLGGSPRDLKVAVDGDGRFTTFSISAPNTTIKGLAIYNSGADGILVDNVNNATITCNNIGTNLTGTTAIPNSGDGLEIQNSSSSTGHISDNVLSGNDGNGINIVDNADYDIRGNVIGLGENAETVIPNGENGILLTREVAGYGYARIGEAGQNMISGNTGNGIEIVGGYYMSWPGQRLSNNIIGEDINAAPAGNGGHGLVLAYDSTGTYYPYVYAQYNNIRWNGGDGVRLESTDSRIMSNTISNNEGNGVFIGHPTDNTSLNIVGSNYIQENGEDGIAVVAYDPDIYPENSQTNMLEENVLANNEGEGIDLYAVIDSEEVNRGATPNDSLDTDEEGGNHMLNTPEILSYEDGEITVSLDVPYDSVGYYDGTYTINIYSNNSIDSNGRSEGESLACTEISLSHLGVGPQQYTFPCDLYSNYITATTTFVPDAGSGMYGETSEFSDVFLPSFLVNSTNDAGDDDAGDGVCFTGATNSDSDPECTLRAAIEESNAFYGGDFINFSIPTSDSGYSNNGTPGDGTDDTWTILPGSALPSIVEILVINGLPAGIIDNSCNSYNLPIILDGSGFGGSGTGFEIEGEYVEIYGIHITEMQSHGISIHNGGYYSKIKCNIIEDSGSGGLASGGIFSDSSGGNIYQKNIIRNNDGSGIHINHSDGEIIGTDPDALATPLGNTIYGNTLAGISTASGRTEPLSVIDNEVYNHSSGPGITIGNADSCYVFRNTSRDNQRGLVVNGSGPDPYTECVLSQNLLYSNSVLNLDLNNDGISANDSEDTDVGPNYLQNYPLLSGYTYDSVSQEVTVSGTLNSAPTSSYRLEFFVDDSITGWVGAGRYIGSTVVTTNSSGDTSFTTPGVTLTGVTLAVGERYLTSTATLCDSPNCTGSLYTSELSPAVSDAGNLIVNSTGDAIDTDPGDGHCNTGNQNSEDQPECTLRAAIEESNLLKGSDSIAFELPTSDSGYSLNGTPGDTSDDYWSIAPSTPLPAILDPTSLDASTQSGTSCVDSNLKVEVDFTNLQIGDYGLTVAATDTSIRGFVLNRSRAAKVRLEIGSDNSVIQCNIIGLDPNGDTAFISPNGIGIQYDTGGDPTVLSGLIVGGDTAEERNIISGNSQGIFLYNAVDSLIQGNYIGTDKSGTLNRSNDTMGVVLSGIGTTGNNLVGGANVVGYEDDCIGECNVIIGGGGIAVQIYQDGNEVVGNFIGTDVTGDLELNSNLSNITASAIDSLLIDNNLIRSAFTNGNSLSNVIVSNNHFIRPATSGNSINLYPPSTGTVDDVLIQSNIIEYSTTSGSGRGIRIPQDATDVTVSQNIIRSIPTDETIEWLAVSPVVSPTLYYHNQDGAQLDIWGEVLGAAANTTHRIEFFGSEEGEAYEAWQYLGSSNVTTNSSGNYNFSGVSPISITATLDPQYEIVTATLTVCGDPSCSSRLSTSEFGTPTEDGQVISGNIYEDQNGDGDITGGYDISGVEVSLYLDDGNGLPDVADSLITSAVTDNNGYYEMVSPYYPPPNEEIGWLVVDSSTVTSLANLEGISLGDQTYGGVGAWCQDDNGDPIVLESAGECFGGISADSADGFGLGLESAEHIIQISLSDGEVSGADFGFSFVVITNSNETGQGSLDQFIINSNNLEDFQTTIFSIPRSDTGCLSYQDNSDDGTVTVGTRVHCLDPQADPDIEWWSIQRPDGASAITDVVHMDGTTQAGASCNPLRPVIELLSPADDAPYALLDSSLVRGFVFDYASPTTISISEANDVQIKCNIFGVDPSGQQGGGVASAATVIDASETDNVQIGGVSLSDRNLINANGGTAISISDSTIPQIRNNYIGVDINGENSLGGGTFTGISMTSVNGASVTNNVIGGGSLNEAVYLEATQNVTVRSNLIGVVPGVDAVNSVPTADGIVSLFSTNLQIGGTSAGQGNIIGGIDKAVNMQATSAQILGNFIGTDSTETYDLGNVVGVALYTEIGADYDVGSQIAPNIIQNNDTGIFLGVGTGSDIYDDTYVELENNEIRDSVVGINASIYSPGVTEMLIFDNTISDTVADGIKVDESYSPSSGNIEIAGNTLTDIGENGINLVELQSSYVTLEANSISETGLAGILINNSSLIGDLGSSITGAGTDGVQILGSTSRFVALGTMITDSGDLGIDIGNDGVTLNDSEDIDSGPNEVQNFPILSLAARFEDTYIIEGVLDSEPNTDYRVVLYFNDQTDPSGHGEGEIYLDYFYLTTDESGHASFNNSSVMPGLPQGQFYVSATATKCSGLPCGEGQDVIATSEFSPTIVLASSDSAGLIEVNSTGSLSDSLLGDGICYTGQLNSDSEPECTLEAAVAETNALAGEDVVLFDIPNNDPGCLSFVNNGISGTYNNLATEVNCLAGNADPDIRWWRINPTINHYYLDSPVYGISYDLPEVKDDLVLNATTQSGYRAGTAVYPAVPNGQPVVQITCEKTYCIYASDSNQISIQGLALSPNASIPPNVIVGGYVGQVQSSFIGTDISGLETSEVDFGIDAVSPSGCSPNFYVGGVTPQVRNVIAGYRESGIRVRACGSTSRIQGNLIGALINANPQPDQAVNGIYSVDANGIEIGGGTGAGNLIAGNIHGIRSVGTSNSSLIQGNEIYANNYGVYATNSNISILNNNIFSNTIKGIALESTSQNLSFSQNSIYLNGDIGIDLDNDGVTPNDYQDPDLGANERQNFPQIIAATRTLVTDQFTILAGLNSKPNSNYFVEFYVSDAIEANNNVEGRVYLGNTQVTTNSEGSSGINVTLPGQTLGESYVYVTAVATECSNPSCTQLSDSSEFSAHYELDYAGTLATIDIAQLQIEPTDSLTITLNEPDANLFPLAIDRAPITLRNEMTNEIENILLSETAINSGIFRTTFGTVLYTGSNSQSNNGVLAVSSGDTVRAFYLDTTSPVTSTQNVSDTALVLENLPPIAVDDEILMPVAGSGSVNVLSNDSDPEGALDPASLAIAVTPVNTAATVELLGGGVIRYNAVAGYVGYDYFDYTICDTDGNCSDATVQVGVGISLPGLTDDNAQTEEDNEVVINVLSNDLDTTGTSNAALNIDTMEIATEPSRGSAFIDPSSGEIEYVPEPNFNGTDRFQYSICDRISLGCSTASVFMTVLPLPDPPVANDDRYLLSTGNIVLNVLDNDWDPDGNLDRDSLVIIEAPSIGAVDIDSDRNIFTYSAVEGANYSTTLIYEICDTEGACDRATVTINYDRTAGRLTVAEILDNIANWVGRRPAPTARTSASIGAIVVPTALVTSLASVIGFNPITIYYLAMSTLSSFISIFTVKKRRVPFGVVYDSVTKEPVSRALVRAYDQNKRLITTAVTDVFGVFEVDLRDGVYSFIVQKNNHIFPSRTITGKVDDPLVNVYHGEPIEVKAGRSLDLSIPLDSGKVPVVSRFETKINSQLKNGFEVLLWSVFALGFVLSIGVLIASFSLFNLAIVLLYVPALLMILISRAAVPSALYSQIVDKNGNPLAGIDIGLKEVGKETYVARRVTDSLGRYRFITKDAKDYELDIITRTYRVVDGDTALSKGIYRKRTKQYNVIGKKLVIEKITV